MSDESRESRVIERYVSAMNSSRVAFPFPYLLIVLIGIALINVFSAEGTGCDSRELPNGNLCNLSAIQFTGVFLRVHFVFERSSPRYSTS